MLYSVAIRMSPSGCLTETKPGLPGCLNWWCAPFPRAKYQPAASSILITCLLFMVVIKPTVLKQGLQPSYQGNFANIAPRETSKENLICHKLPLKLEKPR